MAHTAQKDFFKNVKEIFPDKFNNASVIDCGSLDVNGSLKDLFTNCDYIGVDIVPGKNVDVVLAIKDLPDKQYDTVVSGEMLEHDEYWAESLLKMYAIAKNGGLIAISAAGEGRPEHGTARTTGKDKIWGTSPDYYQNITEEMIEQVYKKDMFVDYRIKYNADAKDIYFYGIKI